MTDNTVLDAVDAAQNADANGFKEVIGSLLQGKVADALQVRKLEVAYNFFGDNEEDVEDEFEDESDIDDIESDQRPDVDDEYYDDEDGEDENGGE